MNRDNAAERLIDTVFAMTSIPDHWLVLEGAKTTLIVKPTFAGPVVIYWGAKLANPKPEMVDNLLTRKMPNGGANLEVPIALCPTRGSGFSGHAGVEFSQGETGWDFAPKITGLTQKNNGATYELFDPVRQIALHHTISLHAETDVLKFATTVENLSENALSLGWLCAASIPLPSPVDHLTGFHGRWANEFQTHSFEHMPGTYVRENMRGRTSHDSFPGLLAHPGTTQETSGDAYGFHLGWSGNHRIASERLYDGRSFVQMGERLIDGEIILGKGDSYSTPAMFASFSAYGFSGLSQNFQAFVRQNLLADRVKNKPRPVHYNTWEAVYFDHDIDQLKHLAEKAASVGVERFVLDDGWFRGRRGDNAGLGDWYVDKAIYPDGLRPLVDHVLALGMEFGLWFEPEMVNPDSDLYRSHPDWVLSVPTADNIPFRNQLVLDLTKAAVTDYLFDRLDSLLKEYAISYIKWDMNRDINHPGSDGKASVHHQTTALYTLLARLRAAHPTVEIESCSSGGARADYGILEHTDRIWTSDSNDALDRLNIQRGFSFFFPSEVMGSHVGPRQCHTTSRMLSMDMRCATALFGHMGMELDLTELTDAETETLSAATTLYKHLRTLTHSGSLVRLDGKPHAHAFGVISDDKNEALFSYTQTKTRDSLMPETFFFAGLSSTAIYKLNLIWPLDFQNETRGALSHFNGREFPGDVLMKVGLQLPQLHPATTLVFQLKNDALIGR